MFHKRMSMAKSSEHAVGPFMASAYRIRQFVQEKSHRQAACVPLVRQNLCDTNWHVWRPGVGH